MTDDPQLIAVESIDKGGGSTVAEALSYELFERDVGHFLTSEPTESSVMDFETTVGDVMDDVTADDPWAEALLFMADRAAHQSAIEQALDSGNHVICDRYMASTIAYQGPRLSMPTGAAISHLDTLHYPWCRPPDLTVWVDTRPDEAEARYEDKPYTTDDAFESRERQVAAHDAYRQYFRYGDAKDVIRVDGSPHEDVMCDRSVEQVMEWLKVNE